MKKNNAFAEYVVADLLSDLEGVRARAMFGGYGLYCKETIFGIIVEEVLYFKVDASNQAKYKKERSQPFSYATKKGKRVAMSYWEVPAAVLDDREAIQQWALESIKINKK